MACRILIAVIAGAIVTIGCTQNPSTSTRKAVLSDDTAISISPDGQWIAYVSPDSGEIIVRPFTETEDDEYSPVEP